MVDLYKYGNLIRDRLETARDLAGYTREGLSNDESFRKILGREISATEIRDTEEKRSFKSTKFREYFEAFCKFLNTPESVFVEVEDHNEFIQIVQKNLRRKKLKKFQMKTKLIHSFEREHESKGLLAKGEILLLKIVDKNDFKILQCFEIATKLIETKKIEHMNMAVQIYDNLMQIEEYYEEALSHILTSIKYLAYKKAVASAENDDMPISIEKMVNPVKHCRERMIRLLCIYNGVYQFGRKIYLSNLDLSYLNLSAESEADYRYDLRGVWFNKSNIAHSNFSGINLSHANFDSIDFSENACFKNTILKNATFRNSNLKGVNMAQDPTKGSIFLDGMRDEDAGRPFLAARTLFNAKVDKWLEDFLIKEKKGDLLRVDR